MDKYFDLLLDLLEIEDKVAYQELAHQISHAPAEKTFLFAHRGAFILQGYLNLLKGEIMPEEFVLLGDVESSRPLWNQGEKSTYEILDQLLLAQLPQQDILVLDLKVRETYLNKQQKSDIEMLLQEGNKTLWLT